MLNLKSQLTVATLLLLSAFFGANFSNASDLVPKSGEIDGRSAQMLQRFLKTNDTELAKLRNQPNHPRWKQLTKQLDRICKQRDCVASKLYWHTDFRLAKQAAQASGKPILSLRLLGNLDEDLSCANSRFFRIALYSNPEIAQLLRDKYVLHWQSVRPVPKITIDFGDGRKVQQTITGNSIHYILDKDGNPIDALPGLYAPQAFQRHLTQIATFTAKYHQLAPAQRQDEIEQYHRTQLTSIQANWRQDLSKLGVNVPFPKPTASVSAAPSATVAAPIAMSKMAIELPILRRTSAFDRQTDELKAATDNSLWNKLGELHQQDAILAENSRQLIRRKQPQLASLTASTSSTINDPLPELITKFQRLMAIDSIRNEYQLHSQIHQWLIATRPIDVETLNTRVYDRLFLTPNSDPWLGLMPGDGYTGIDRDGIIK